MPRHLSSFGSPLLDSRRSNTDLHLSLVVEEDVPKPCLVGLHVDDGLVSVRQLPLLNHEDGLLLSGNLKHVLDLLWSTYTRATKSSSGTDQSTDRNGLYWTVGDRNVHDVAARSQGLDERSIVLCGVVGSVDDEVQVLLVLAEELSGSFRSRDVVSCPKLERGVLLAWRVTDGYDSLSAQSFGKGNAKGANATDTDDTDSLDVLAASTVSVQWGEDGDTAAHQRSSDGAVKTLWNVDSKVTWSTPLLGVTTERAARSVLELTVVSTDDAVLAEGLLASLAVPALVAGVRLGTNTHSVTDLDVLDVSANVSDLADDLVSDAERSGGLAPTVRHCAEVAHANTCRRGSRERRLLSAIMRPATAAELSGSPLTTGKNVHLNVVIGELLGSVLVPDHLSLDSGGVWAKPSLELLVGVWCVRHCEVGSVTVVCIRDSQRKIRLLVGREEPRNKCRVPSSIYVGGRALIPVSGLWNVLCVEVFSGQKGRGRRRTRKTQHQQQRKKHHNRQYRLPS